MSSINDSLSPDLLFNIFKRLDCIETTIIRRVCKQWWEVIDEHKSFWRTLRLPENSVRWSPSILKLFDQKSDSSLRDVDVKVDVPSWYQSHCFNTLKESRETLKHVLVRVPSGNVDPDCDYVNELPNLQSLIVVHWYKSCNVILKRNGTSSIRDEDAASPLKVLWYASFDLILQIDSSRFQNLVSLDVGDELPPSVWRRFLEDPSRTLKHLRLGFKQLERENHEGISTLNFPALEVLELDSGGPYPQWLIVPVSVKLICHLSNSDLPSISELWLTNIEEQIEEDFGISDRCPELKIVKLFLPSGRDDLVDDVILDVFNERFANVKAGLKVGQVSMGNIKTLILSFGSLTTATLARLKQLVEEVVDIGSVPEYLEIEI